MKVMNQKPGAIRVAPLPKNKESMKVFVKIFILVLAVVLAVGCIMIYAKTKVEPPIASNQINQYMNDLSENNRLLEKKISSTQEDSVLHVALSHIKIFSQEDRITKAEADKATDAMLDRYVPLFLQHSFERFSKNVWNTNDHKYMMGVIGSLKQIQHSDGRLALRKQTVDSLALVENIISRYNQACEVAKHTHFTSVANAQNTINKAQQFAHDRWLSNCTSLVRDLNNVKPRLADSHFQYLSSMVGKLSQYRSLSYTYYENTLVPQVENAVTEYDKKATSLYGSKRSVADLWKRAEAYYDNALEYYNKDGVVD